VDFFNHNLVYGYGDGRFNPQDKVAPNTMWCSYGKVQRPVGSFREECARTAEVIHWQAAMYGYEPVVLLSGGLDSEVVAKAFLESGRPFRTATFRFANGLNSHEVDYARFFLERHGLLERHEWYDMDIEEWCQSRLAHSLFTETQCSFFEMVPHMELMKHLYQRGGLPVLGNGEVLLLKQPDRSWRYVEYEYDLAWYRFERKFGVRGVMGFFQHTAEMMLAALQEPRYQELLAGKNKAANLLLPHSREVKYAIYRDHWPDLVRRKKFDGGEKVRHLFKPLDRKLTAQYAVPYTDVWTCDAGELQASLTMELNRS